jgi:hypothetical protein
MPWSHCRGRRVAHALSLPAYELADEFSTPDANPLAATPRLCEPGPGNLFWRDADNRLSVNFGALTFTNPGSAAWDRTYLYSANPFARKVGRYIEHEWTPQSLDYQRVGWQKAASGLIGDNVAMTYFGGGGGVNVVDDLDVAATNYPYAALTSYLCRLYDSGSGFYYYIADRATTPRVWYLLWRKDLSPSRLNTVWPAIQNIAQDGTMQYFRIRQGKVPLPAVLVRQPVANEFRCGAANGLFEATLTLATGKPCLFFRYSDTNNWWKLEADIAAGFLRLKKNVAGVTTTVASVAATLTAGEVLTLRVVAFKQYIRSFIGMFAGPTATSTDLQTAMSCGVGADATYTMLRCDTGSLIAN